MTSFGQFKSIAGVSDVLHFPRVGVIRLGVKVENQQGREYPKEVEHFVTKREDFDDPTIHDQFVAKYGLTPTELDIMFPVEDREVFFPQSYKKYGSSGLLCQGDGVTYARLDTQSGEMSGGPCPSPEFCPFARDGKNRVVCSRVGNLTFLLPLVSWAGVLSISTSSFYSIADINSGIEMFRQLAGRIQLVPLKLFRKARETRHEGKKATHWTMKIRFPSTSKEIRGLLEEGQRVRQVFTMFQPIQTTVQPQLTAPGEADLFPPGAQPQIEAPQTSGGEAVVPTGASPIPTGSPPSTVIDAVPPETSPQPPPASTTQPGHGATRFVCARCANVIVASEGALCRSCQTDTSQPPPCQCLFDAQGVLQQKCRRCAEQEGQQQSTRTIAQQQEGTQQDLSALLGESLG